MFKTTSIESMNLTNHHLNYCLKLTITCQHFFVFCILFIYSINHFYLYNLKQLFKQAYLILANPINNQSIMPKTNQNIFINFLIVIFLINLVSTSNISQSHVQLYDVPIHLSKPVQMSVQTGFRTYFQIQQIFPQLKNILISSNISNQTKTDRHFFTNIQSISISLKNYPSSLTGKTVYQNPIIQSFQSQCSIQSPQIQFINMSSLVLQKIKNRPRIITNYKDILNEETLIDVHYFNRSMFLAATNNNFFLAQIQQKKGKNNQVQMKLLASSVIPVQTSISNGFFLTNRINLSPTSQISQSQQNSIYFFSNQINYQVNIQVLQGIHKIQLINQDLLPIARQDMVDAIIFKQKLFIMTSKQILVYNRNEQSKHYNIVDQIILEQIFKDVFQNNILKPSSAISQLVDLEYVKQHQEIIVLDSNYGLFIIFQNQPSKNFHIPIALSQCTSMTLIDPYQSKNKQSITASCQNIIIKIQIDSNDLTYTIQKHENLRYYITQIQQINKNQLLLKGNEDFHILYQNHMLGLNDNIRISNPFVFKENQNKEKEQEKENYNNILLWMDQKTLNLEKYLIKDQKVLCKFDKADQKILYMEVVADCNQQYLNSIVPSITQNVTQIMQNNNYCRYKSKIQMNIWQKVELQEWLIPTLTVIMAIVLIGGIILFFQIRKINFYRNTKQFGIQFQDQN